METNVVVAGSDMDQPSRLNQTGNSGYLIPVTSCQGTLTQPNECSLEENRILLASVTVFTRLDGRHIGYMGAFGGSSRLVRTSDDTPELRDVSHLRC